LLLRRRLPRAWRLLGSASGARGRRGWDVDGDGTATRRDTHPVFNHPRVGPRRVVDQEQGGDHRGRQPVGVGQGAVAELLFGPLVRRGSGAAAFAVLGWDLEQGPCVTVRHGDTALMIDLAARDDAEPCYAATDRFNVYARRLFRGDGRDMDEADRAVVDEVVELLREGERRLPLFDRPTRSTRATVREIRVERALVQEGAGQYYLNPYVGCMIGCPYCWVAERADLGRALEGLPHVPWGRWVDAKVDLPEVLATEVRRYPPGPVRMSPVVTDPYQPLERKYRITRRCLEALLPAGFAPVVLTRATRVVEDLELLSRFERAAVGLSIPTDDDRVRQRFEPGADAIEARIETLERLHRAGLRTFGVVQPILPMDPVRLVARVAPLVSHVRIDRMHHIRRALPLYREFDMEDAADETYAARIGDRLRRDFESRGVLVDDLDDMAALVREV